jgi:hypothetical protein
MSEDRTNKIIEAAETCLALALGQRDSLSRVSAYLKTLQASENWEESEVIDVQVRVIRALMRRGASYRLSVGGRKWAAVQ